MLIEFPLIAVASISTAFVICSGAKWLYLNVIVKFLCPNSLDTVVMSAPAITGFPCWNEADRQEHILQNQSEFKNSQYITFDDFAQIEAAKSDPDGFINTDEPFTIDEAQKCPEILIAIQKNSWDSFCCLALQTLRC